MPLGRAVEVNQLPSRRLQYQRLVQLSYAAAFGKLPGLASATMISMFPLPALLPVSRLRHLDAYVSRKVGNLLFFCSHRLDLLYSRCISIYSSTGSSNPKEISRPTTDHSIFALYLRQDLRSAIHLTWWPQLLPRTREAPSVSSSLHSTVMLGDPWAWRSAKLVGALWQPIRQGGVIAASQACRMGRKLLSGPPRRRSTVCS